MPDLARHTYPPTVDETQRLWTPDGVIAETGEGRYFTGGSQAILTSGTLRVTGLVVAPAGKTISQVRLVSGSTAAVTPLNQWFCIVRLSDFAVMAKTVDDTTAAWGTTTVKTLALTAPWTPSVNTPVYVGACVVATTTPSLIGWSVGTAVIGGANPKVGGDSTTGLTTPASLGATIAAVANGSQFFYAALL